MILFGSCINRDHFVLDTVFVVDRSVEHSYENLEEIARQVSRTYDEVTLRPWYATLDAGLGGDPTRRCRLYWGATPARPIDGMFSFFPALPEPSAPNGFPRPTIRLKKMITDNHPQGYKATPGSIEEMRKMWSSVRDQVHAQGCSLGVNAEMPPRRQRLREEPRRDPASCQPKRNTRPKPASC